MTFRQIIAFPFFIVGWACLGIASSIGARYDFTICGWKVELDDG